MEEKQLVQNAVSGDREAFGMLYSLYKDRLYRYAYYRLTDIEFAEDAVSDCVLSAYSQITKLKRPEAFSSWLFRILYCSCNEQIKRLGEQRRTADLDETASVLADGRSEMVTGTELKEALSILKDDDKEIVLMAVVLGLNSKEIGKLKDLTSGNVRIKLSRSLKKMRKFLEGER